jgi:hypothetical protein
LWRRHIEYLDKFLKRASHADEADRLGIGDQLARARKTAEQVDSPAYLESLRGTIGAEPIEAYIKIEPQPQRNFQLANQKT